MVSRSLLALRVGYLYHPFLASLQHSSVLNPYIQSCIKFSIENSTSLWQCSSILFRYSSSSNGGAHLTAGVELNWMEAISPVTDPVILGLLKESVRDQIIQVNRWTDGWINIINKWFYDDDFYNSVDWSEEVRYHWLWWTTVGTIRKL